MSAEDTRRRLLSAGYSPVPCVGKIPVLKAWQKQHDPTLIEIEQWSRTAPAATNTGILTRAAPTLDIDIIDPEAAKAVEALARERFEDRGDILVRFGLPPKRCIPFRTDAPFAKIKRVFGEPDTPEGDCEKLELLCDGQQIVVDGIHPDTRRPYSWAGDAPGETPREDLPYIHDYEALALIDDAAALLVEKFGYRLRLAKPKGGNGADGEPPTDWSFTPDDLTDHDRLAALAMRLVKSGMGPGAAVNFLRGGVAGLVNVVEERRQRRLKEIPGMVSSAEAKLEERRPPAKPKADGDQSDSGPRSIPPIEGEDKGLAGGIIDTGAPYDTARLFQRALGAPLKYHRGAFYEWDGSAWPQASEDMLRARLYAFLDQCQTKPAKGDRCQAVKPNVRMVSGVLDALRGAAYLERAIEPPAWLDDPGGPPPQRWLAFLSQLWPDDPVAIATLQQIFGYCLSADTSQQKAFLIVGPKRSGKGTIGRVLTRLVGPHNCAAPTLASLGTNFGLAPLIGKNLAIISDARLSGRVDQHIIAESLLAITGEDTRTIDRKYAQSWTGKLPTRFVVLTNELPKLADVSGALASRFILLMLAESFYGREDHGLTDTLVRELPGILNWSLAGWAALSRAGRFDQPASSKEAMEQLEDLTSPVGAFVRERCELGAAYTANVDDVFGAWETWCEGQRREHTGTVQSFARDLRAAVPGLKIAQPRQGGARVRVYQGLRLR